MKKLYKFNEKKWTCVANYYISNLFVKINGKIINYILIFNSINKCSSFQRGEFYTMNQSFYLFYKWIDKQAKKLQVYLLMRHTCRCERCSNNLFRLNNLRHGKISVNDWWLRTGIEQIHPAPINLVPHAPVRDVL